MVKLCPPARPGRHTPFQNALKRRQWSECGFAAGKEALVECRCAYVLCRSSCGCPAAKGFEKGYDTRLFPTQYRDCFLQEHRLLWSGPPRSFGPPGLSVRFRSAGESDGTVCPQGKKCLSEAVARAESLHGLGDDLPGWQIEAMNTGCILEPAPLRAVQGRGKSLRDR